MKYFDAHCHVQFPQYAEDREVLLDAMHDAQVGGLIVGVDLESSRTALDLVQGTGTLYAAAGLHPNYTQAQAFDEDAFRELIQDPHVVAIGECGLDYYRPEDMAGARAMQKEVFQKHIELAVEFQKPLMIHARPSKGSQDAYHDALDMLQSAKREYGDALTGNMHFFVGGIEEARGFVDLDFTMSYTAVLTFTHDYDEVVRFIPRSHLLTETDAPYAAPVENRGKRNDPLAVQRVVEAMAAIRGEDPEAVRVDILKNAERVFRISPGNL